MIHLISATNAHLYREQIATFHAARRRHFIFERGWPLEEREGGEFDAYDDEHSLVLLGLSGDGDLEVACRLRRTTAGGLIPDIFPHLIAETEGDGREEGTFECTRYFTTGAARGRRGFEQRSRLHVAMVEAVRDRGGRRLLGFADLLLLTHLRRFSGLRLKPIGLPFPYDEEGNVTVAFEIGVSQGDLEETRRRLEIPTRQLFEAPAWLPETVDVIALEQAAATLIEADASARATLREVARRASRVRHQPDVEGVMSRLSGMAA